MRSQGRADFRLGVTPTPCPTPYANSDVQFGQRFAAIGIAGKWVMITAVAPQSYCTSVASIQNFGGYLGGSASPLVTGFVVDQTGSFVIALAIGAGMTLGAAVLLQLLVRDPIGAAELGGTPVPVPVA